MAEKVFHGIVTQFDCDKQFREQHPDMTPAGPMLWEQTLLERYTLEVLQRRVDELGDSHGWARIAKVIVDIPEGES